MHASDMNEATGLHPTARPAEKREDIEFAEKDAGLRKDVHNLGIMVGELLREQGGATLFNVVEKARLASIGRREGDTEAGRELDAIINGLSADISRDFIRAFSTYFQVVNTAEQVHRIRRRRDYLKDTAIRQPGGIEESIFKLHDSGVQIETIEGLLRSLCIEPVFTPHPTEPTRRTILRKQQNIIRRLIDIQNPNLTPQERISCFEIIRADVTSIWQTEENPHEQRSVFDDLEHLLFYFTDIIYRALPAFYETLERSLNEAYGEKAENMPVPTMICFATWIGGDMDSRQEITARTIRETMARQRSLILDLYFRECQKLSEKLSQSTDRIKASDSFLNRIQHYTQSFPNAAGKIPLRHRNMPYRNFLRLVMERLQATHDDDSYPYESFEEFLDDIRLLETSLDTNKGRYAGLFGVRRLIRRIESFGFHFLTLDIRQDAIKNRSVVGRCLGEEGWLEQSAEYRTERIRKALHRNESPFITPDNESKRALAVFQTIAFCRRKHGKRAIGLYVVSMAHGIDDVLSVILMARWGDLSGKHGAVPLDIAPYFETVDDLTDCAANMRDLLEDPLYRDHLTRRDNRQTVMVSYSDSNKDGGLASARWSLQQAQSSLVDTLDAANMELTLFHGRGGTISRGGGKTHAAVLGSPPGAVHGRLRATEQGELVDAKYGVREIALRTLEQAVGSVALATAMPVKKQVAERDEWNMIMETVTTMARNRYQNLVYDSPDFYDYFRLATPVDVIEQMQYQAFGDAPTIPVDNEDLKNVPWDFSWTQSRHMLPGWYGLGTGLAHAINHHGIEKIQEMARSWYFFRALIADVETVLSKSDLNIANRYSELSGTLHEQFFPLMRTEFDLSVETVLSVKNQQVLLENNSTMRRSIRLRNPYVDPMSLLQVELLHRWREKGCAHDMLFDALTASVNGIARGLQDSG